MATKEEILAGNMERALASRERAFKEYLRCTEICESRVAAVNRVLISLSGGALIFSMTFVDRLAPEKQKLPFLFVAWLGFGASIICVVLAMRAAEHSAGKGTFVLGKLIKQFDDDLINKVREGISLQV